jgi:CBS domain-containing protein
MSILDQKTFISAISPFDRLRNSEFEAVTEAMDIAYFKPGVKLIARNNPAPDHLYIIIKGLVQEVDEEEEIIALHVSQDSFDAMSLIDGQCKNEFIVQEELLCYLLPKEIFLTLIHNNTSFQTFYYQNLSQRLDHLIDQRNNKELVGFMVAKIGEAYIHPPIFVDANASIYQAVEILEEHKATSVLVNKNNEIGIVTDTDIRKSVVLQRQSVDSAVGNIATYNLLSMQKNDFLFNALLKMTKHTIKRLIIYDEQETIVGVLDQMDLLSFFSNHSHLIAVQIERATTTEQLKKASLNLISMIQTLYAKGLKIKYISQLVSELNGKIFNKLYNLVAPVELVENSCFIVMGSEGRSEQIIKTDQDNALIWRNDFVYDSLNKIKQELTEILIDFGYPPCPGNIMVSNPAWSQSLKTFQEAIFHWIEYPHHNTLMNLAIFYDATVVAGDELLLQQAKDYLFNLLTDNKSYFSHFAKPTLAFETPLGIFANFIVEKSQHKDQLDIKKGGIFPIVHGIRSLALEHKLTQTNTMERIQVLRDKGLFSHQFAEELMEAFGFMLSLRLQAELEKIQLGYSYDNYITPSQLNKLERDLLKDALKIVNEFKKFITYHFKLNMVS